MSAACGQKKRQTRDTDIPGEDFSYFYSAFVQLTHTKYLRLDIEIDTFMSCNCLQTLQLATDEHKQLLLLSPTVF